MVHDLIDHIFLGNLLHVYLERADTILCHTNNNNVQILYTQIDREMEARCTSVTFPTCSIFLDIFTTVHSMSIIHKKNGVNFCFL